MRGSNEPGPARGQRGLHGGALVLVLRRGADREESRAEGAGRRSPPRRGNAQSVRTWARTAPPSRSECGPGPRWLQPSAGCLSRGRAALAGQAVPCRGTWGVRSVPRSAAGGARPAPLGQRPRPGPARRRRGTAGTPQGLRGPSRARERSDPSRWRPRSTQGRRWRPRDAGTPTRGRARRRACPRERAGRRGSVPRAAGTRPAAAPAARCCGERAARGPGRIALRASRPGG